MPLSSESTTLSSPLLIVSEEICDVREDQSEMEIETLKRSDSYVFGKSIIPSSLDSVQRSFGRSLYILLERVCLPVETWSKFQIVFSCIVGMSYFYWIVPFLYYNLEDLMSSSSKFQVALVFGVFFITQWTNWIAGIIFISQESIETTYTRAMYLPFIDLEALSEFTTDLVAELRRKVVIISSIGIVLQYAFGCLLVFREGFQTIPLSVQVFSYVLIPSSIGVYILQPTLVCAVIVVTLRIQLECLKALRDYFRTNSNLESFDLSAGITSYRQLYEMIVVRQTKSMRVFVSVLVGASLLGLVVYLRAALNSTLPASAFSYSFAMGYMGFLGFSMMWNIASLHSEWEQLCESLARVIDSSFLNMNLVATDKRNNISSILSATHSMHLPSSSMEGNISIHNRIIEWQAFMSYVRSTPLTFELLGVKITPSLVAKTFYLVFSVVIFASQNLASTNRRV